MQLGFSEVNSLKTKFLEPVNRGGQQGRRHPAVSAREGVLGQVQALQAAPLHLQAGQNTRHQLVPPQAAPQHSLVEEPQVIEKQRKDMGEVVVA